MDIATPAAEEGREGTQRKLVSQLVLASYSYSRILNVANDSRRIYGPVCTLYMLYKVINTL